MCWFRDRLYVGTARANLYLIKRRNPPPQWPVYPVNAPEDPFTLDLRAQIRRYEPVSDTWEHVHTAPVVPGRDGKPIPREIGYRGMAVFQGTSDAEPVLYVSCFSPTRSPGPMIFRSEDGTRFDPVSAPGLGYDGISAFRTLVPFKGRLYISPVGSTRNRPNASTYPIVFESADPASGQWRMVSEPGFGNPANTGVFEMTVFDGELYAGTLNCVTGFEIWKTDAEGPAPYRWTQVMRLGAFRGNLNEAVLSLCPFGDALYVGTAIQDGGFDQRNRVGPAAGEVIRLYPDTSWDLVVGQSRLTPYGAKIATSGMIPGFDNFFNGYIWRMCAHDGWLYVGTWDWSLFLAWAQIEKWPPPIRDLIEAIGIQEIIRREAGFDLWKTRDGDTWTPVTRTGFDNPYNCGCRTMASTPFGLAIGSTNPFGPEVATRAGDGWRYAPNPRGGLEVWLGSARSAPAAPAPAAPPAPERIAAGDAGAAARPARRHARGDAARFERTPAQLAELARKINVASVRPDWVAFARSYHHLRLEGADHLPPAGAALIASNHTGTPLLAGTTFITEDLLLTANLLVEHQGRPARFLVDTKYYDDELVARLARKTINRLGYVPITLDNGVRLLEMGETVVIYPEGRDSAPAYGTEPFFWGFAKMAWLARAPIVPAALIGPHESRPRIAQPGRRQVYVNMQRPLQSEYRLILLPPIDARDYLPTLEDAAALREFSEMVRRRIQARLDLEGAARPLFALARELQARHGAGDPHARSNA
jgi:1-acyl-sn-glycerol-3-phosphate acyltransferase